MRRFLFRLALALGMTVRDLSARLDSRELSEWIAYYSVEPWGDERADLRQAITSCLLANIHKDKGHPGFEPADFMPLIEKDAKKDSAGDLALRMLVRRPGWGEQPKK